MTITKLGKKTYRISDIINGYLVNKLYLGYTKKEALKMFKINAKILINL